LLVHVFALTTFTTTNIHQDRMTMSDYVKYDWHPNDVPTTRHLAEGLRKAGRDIVLSLSNDATFDDVKDLSSLANLWRTTGDIHESWESINRIGFSQDEWHPFSRPGHWNDPDMLQVGMIGNANAANHSAHRTSLTPDEQYAQVSLWVLLSEPLLLSCDLSQMDAFTFSLLANDEVIEVDQDPKGKAARRLPGMTRFGSKQWKMAHWRSVFLTGVTPIRSSQ
jgi:alpha-galactosidase